MHSYHLPARKVFLTYSTIVVMWVVVLLESSRVLQLLPHDQQFSKITARNVISTRSAAINSNRGFVIGWEFTEEQTCAARNLLGLQHWATTIDVDVVEPFVYKSYFTFSYFLGNPSVNKLRFRDYLDIDYWNSEVVTKHLGKPLVSWENFIKYASRDMIVVYVMIDSPVGTKVYVNKAIDEDCILPHGYGLGKNFSATTSFTQFGFRIVRSVCFKFFRRSPMPVTEFNKHILGPYNSSSVSIVFTSFPGVLPGRITLREKKYDHESVDWFKSSERVTADSERYVKMFLANDNFTAVAIRTMKLAIDRGSTATDFRLKKLEPFFKRCISSIEAHLSKTSHRHFLALDIGRYGDTYQTVLIAPQLLQYLIDSLIKVVYNSTWNQLEYEQSFITATGGISDSGYIAAVQREIVLKASSLIMGGTGNFQQYVINVFKSKHKGNSAITLLCAK